MTIIRIVTFYCIIKKISVVHLPLLLCLRAVEISCSQLLISLYCHVNKKQQMVLLQNLANLLLFFTLVDMFSICCVEF